MLPNVCSEDAGSRERFAAIDAFVRTLSTVYLRTVNNVFNFLLNASQYSVRPSVRPFPIYFCESTDFEFDLEVFNV